MSQTVEKPRMPLSDVPTWALSWVIYSPTMILWRVALNRRDWELDRPGRGFGWIDWLEQKLLRAARWVQGDGYGPWPAYRDLDKRVAWEMDQMGKPF